MKTVQPRKQHKMLYQAPAHMRYKHFSASLSPSLKTTHHVNSIPVRTGDTVRIMRGDRKGSEGKVTRIDRKKYRIFVEGITREKVDGSAVLIPVHPSKVVITNLSLDDRWRRESLKAEVVKEAEKPAEEVKKQRKEEKATQNSLRKSQDASKKKGENTDRRDGRNDERRDRKWVKRVEDDT